MSDRPGDAGHGEPSVFADPYRWHGVKADSQRVVENFAERDSFAACILDGFGK